MPESGEVLQLSPSGFADPLSQLAGVEEIHRREDAETTGFREGGAGTVQDARNLGRSARHDPQPFEQPKQSMGQPAAGGRAAEAGERQARADEGLIPGDAGRGFGGQIAGLRQFEADLPQRVVDLMRPGDIGQAAADLYVGLQALVIRVVSVEPVGQAIFVGRETSAGLEHAEGLAIDAGLVGRAAGGLDGIGGVERGVRRVDLHEVAFEPVGQMAQPRRLAPPVGAFEMQRVVADADDPGATETGDLDQRPANATTQVYRRHAGPQGQPVGNVVFVASERRGEAFISGAKWKDWPQPYS